MSYFFDQLVMIDFSDSLISELDLRRPHEVEVNVERRVSQIEIVVRFDRDFFLLRVDKKTFDKIFQQIASSGVAQKSPFDQALFLVKASGSFSGNKISDLKDLMQ